MDRSAEFVGISPARCTCNFSKACVAGPYDWLITAHFRCDRRVSTAKSLEGGTS